MGEGKAQGIAGGFPLSKEVATVASFSVAYSEDDKSQLHKVWSYRS